MTALSAIGALALFAVSLWSQETRGVILGRVTDPSSAFGTINAQDVPRVWQLSLRATF